MATYTVLEHPVGNATDVIFLREGFVVGAFALTAIWALWHRMWVVAAVLFALLVALGMSAQIGVPSHVAGLLDLGVGLVFGFEARRLQILALERAGYRNIGIIEASHRETAELSYFAERSRQRSARTLRKTPADDMLNLFGNV